MAEPYLGYYHLVKNDAPIHYIRELEAKIVELENKYYALQVVDGCIINRLRTQIEELQKECTQWEQKYLLLSASCTKGEVG